MMNNHSTKTRKTTSAVFPSLVALLMLGLVAVSFLTRRPDRSPQSLSKFPEQADSKTLEWTESTVRELREDSKNLRLNDFVANCFNLRFFEAALMATGRYKYLEGEAPHTFFFPCDEFFAEDEDQKILKEKLKLPSHRTHLVSFCMV